MYVVIIVGVIIGVWLIWKYWALAVGAGYDPTPMHRVQKMLELAEVETDDIVYDLGSGDGRVLLTSSRRFGARAVGIEIDPCRFLFSFVVILLSGVRKKATVRYGSIFAHSISEATVVTLFLYQSTNNKLKQKLLRELRPGTRIVTYLWTFDEWIPEQCLLEDKIYLYIVGKSGKTLRDDVH